MKASHIPALLTTILAGSFPSPSRAEGVVVQWEKVYNGPGNGQDSARAIAVDDAGNVIVTGESQGSSGNSDFYTAKYAAGDGTLLWERRYNGPGTLGDFPRRLAVDREGNAIVAGVSGSSNFWIDFYTAKYAAANGALLWEKRYNGPVDGTDGLNGMALDSAGNVIVTGEASAYRVGGSYYSDYYTAKYAAANGALLWQKFYNATGIVTDRDRAEYLVIDKADNVIVTGYTSRRDSNNYDIVVSSNTVKYAAGDGDLLWSASLGGSPHAVDDAGNIFVVSVTDGDGLKTTRTAKYAAANGALLWDKRYILPGNATLSHSTVKVDGEQNIVVTGHVYSDSDSSGNMHTVKYAGADGLLIWEVQKRYSLPATATVFDVEMDGAGNLFVTGDYHNSSGGYDNFTAKYASGSGALLWEMRHNGTGLDRGHRLLVDGLGSVIVSGKTYHEPGGSSGSDFYTVKYAPVDLDGDHDGLLDSWEIAHFGDTAIHSALDDTDGDGAVELLELAFGTDPGAPNSVPAPAVVIEGGYLTTTITTQPCVRYLVETGATLEAGFSATSTTVLTETATTLKVRDNVPVGTQPARFLRVRVTAPP